MTANAESSIVKGVDQQRGDHCSAIAYRWAETTFGQRPDLLPHDLKGGFAQVLRIDGAHLAMTSDGIGTKIEVAERMARYDTLGFDLVAMVADDLVAAGAEPLALSNILDVTDPDPSVIDALMQGLAAAASACRMAVTGGEIAQLGSRIGGWGDGMRFNWAATAIGRVDPARGALHPEAVTAGDAILALASDGFRSNGFTLVREILAARYGEAWHTETRTEGETWGDALLTPAVLYAPGVVDGWTKGLALHGAVHVTGGGIAGNLSRILRQNQLGASLDDLWPPHDAMMELASLGGLTTKKAYGQWNMGNGMLLAVPNDAAEPWIEILEGSGIRARQAGEITDTPTIALQTPSGRWTTGLEAFE